MAESDSAEDTSDEIYVQRHNRQEEDEKRRYLELQAALLKKSHCTSKNRNPLSPRGPTPVSDNITSVLITQGSEMPDTSTPEPEQILSPTSASRKKAFGKGKGKGKGQQGQGKGNKIITNASTPLMRPLKIILSPIVRPTSSTPSLSTTPSIDLDKLSSPDISVEMLEPSLNEPADRNPSHSQIPHHHHSHSHRKGTHGHQHRLTSHSLRSRIQTRLQNDFVYELDEPVPLPTLSLDKPVDQPQENEEEADIDIKAVTPAVKSAPLFVSIPACTATPTFTRPRSRSEQPVRLSVPSPTAPTTLQEMEKMLGPLPERWMFSQAPANVPSNEGKLMLYFRKVV